MRKSSNTASLVGRVRISLLFFLLAVVAVLLLFTQSRPVTVYAAPDGPDPGLVLGHKDCLECHEAAVDALKKTKHFASYKSIRKSKDAKDMIAKLGLKGRVNKVDACTSCHFTMQKGKKSPKAVEAVSCEACHGAGKNWLPLHKNYGAHKSWKKEPAEHRLARLGKAQAKGMIHSEMPYEGGARCFECHTVADENLVNKTSHPDGTGFELVSWMLGSERHNFERDKKNAEATAARKSMWYVLGRALQLEFGLKALAGGNLWP